MKEEVKLDMKASFSLSENFYAFLSFLKKSVSRFYTHCLSCCFFIFEFSANLLIELFQSLELAGFLVQGRAAESAHFIFLSFFSLAFFIQS